MKLKNYFILSIALMFLMTGVAFAADQPNDFEEDWGNSIGMPKAADRLSAETFGWGNLANGGYSFENYSKLGARVIGNGEVYGYVKTDTVVDISGGNHVSSPNFAKSVGKAFLNSKGEIYAIAIPMEYYNKREGIWFCDWPLLGSEELRVSSDGVSMFGFQFTNEVYQNNSAYAYAGNGPDATWAEGGNYGGAASEVFYYGKGQLQYDKHSKTTYILGFPICEKIYNESGDATSLAQLEVKLKGWGITKAWASRDRAANYAWANSGAFTIGGGTAYTADLSVDPGDRFKGRPTFNEKLVVFGGGSVEHFTFAELPDGSAMAGTYGRASYELNIQVSNAQQDLSGHGWAKTYGNTNITRNPSTGAVHVEAHSFSEAHSGISNASSYNRPD